MSLSGISSPAFAAVEASACSAPPAASASGSPLSAGAAASPAASSAVGTSALAALLAPVAPPQAAADRTMISERPKHSIFSFFICPIPFIFPYLFSSFHMCCSIEDFIIFMNVFIDKTASSFRQKSAPSSAYQMQKRGLQQSVI
jgi:hypothetical protein